VDGCQCAYNTNVEKRKALVYRIHTSFFLIFGGVKFRQNEGYKIKERIFCHNFLLYIGGKFFQISKLKKKPIRHIWTFDFSLVAFLKLGF
jgi:hypothetical protein